MTCLALPVTIYLLPLTASQVRGLPGGCSLTSAREPEKLDHVAHVLQPARKVDVLVSGAVDGADGAVVQFQPLTTAVYYVPIIFY